MAFNIVENKKDSKDMVKVEFEAQMAQKRANKIAMTTPHINKENIWNRCPKSVRSIIQSLIVVLVSFIIAYNNTAHQSALVIWVEQIKFWETGFVNFDNGIWINISAFVFYFGLMYVLYKWNTHTRGSIKFEKMIVELLWQQELFNTTPAIVKGNVAEQVEKAYTKVKSNGKKVKKKSIKMITLEVERQYRLVCIPYLEAIGVNNNNEKV